MSWWARKLAVTTIVMMLVTTGCFVRRDNSGSGFEKRGYEAEFRLETRGAFETVATRSRTAIEAFWSTKTGPGVPSHILVHVRDWIPGTGNFQARVTLMMLGFKGDGVYTVPARGSSRGQENGGLTGLRLFVRDPQYEGRTRIYEEPGRDCTFKVADFGKSAEISCPELLRRSSNPISLKVSWKGKKSFPLLTPKPSDQPEASAPQ